MQEPSPKINLIPTERTQLRGPEPVAICNKNHRRVAMTIAPAFARAVHQLRDFLDSEIFAWPSLGVLDPPRRNCPVYSAWRWPTLGVFGR